MILRSGDWGLVPCYYHANETMFELSKIWEQGLCHLEIQDILPERESEA